MFLAGSFLSKRLLCFWLSCVFFVSLEAKYQKPTCYWYWWEGVNDFRDLRWEDIDSRNQSNVFVKHNDNNWKKRYFVKYDLVRKAFSRKELIPLKDNPASFSFILRPDEKIDARSIYGRYPGGERVDERVDSQIEDWGWNDHSREDIVRHALDKWPTSFLISINYSAWYNNLEEGLLIYNHARHYEYGPGKASYDAGGVNLLVEWGFKLSSDNKNVSSIRNRVVAKKMLLHYGDKVKLVSTGSYLVLFAQDKGLPSENKVFASHDDTDAEYAKLKKIIPEETPEDFSWFYIKGPYKKYARWNCKLGDPVKPGDKIRLEHVASGKNLMLDIGSSPATSSLLFADSIKRLDSSSESGDSAFVNNLAYDYSYLGSSGVVSENLSGKNEVYKYPGKPTSDEKRIILSNDAVGSELCDLEIVAQDLESSGDEGLVIGNLFGLKFSTIPNTYLWSQHAYFKCAAAGGDWLGLVSGLTLSNVEADLKSCRWFVLATDGPNIEDLNKSKYQMLGESSVLPEVNLTSLCHAVLQDSKKSYFQSVKASDFTNYPALNQESFAKSFLEVFINFYKTLDVKFWKKWSEAPVVVKKTLNKLKSMFPNSEQLASTIDDFLFQIINENPAFKSNNFRDIMIEIESLFSEGSDKNTFLKQRLIELSNNVTELYSKPGFDSIENLLDSTKNPSSDSNFGKIGASLFLAWLQVSQKDLIGSGGVFNKAEYSDLVTKLKNIEKKVYTGPDESGLTKVEIGFAKVDNFLKALDAAVNDQDPVAASFDKLLNSLEGLFSNQYEVLISQEQVAKIIEGLEFLNGKFGSTFGLNDRFKKSIESMQTINPFGVVFLISMFNSKLIKLSDSQQKDVGIKPIDLVNILKNIVSLKAEFYIGQQLQSLTDFVEALKKLLILNDKIKTYEDSFKNKSFAESADSFGSLLIMLQESPTFNDYFYFFKQISSQVKNSKSADILKPLVEKSLNEIINKPLFLNQLSSAQWKSIISICDYLNTNFSFSLSARPPSVDTTDFNSYLKNLKAQILAGRDKSLGGWRPTILTTADLNTGDSFVNFCLQVSRFTEFNPDFSNDVHKIGFASILKFVQLSFSNLLNAVNLSDEKLDRIRECLVNINRSLSGDKNLKAFILNYQ